MFDHSILMLLELVLKTVMLVGGSLGAEKECLL